MTSVSSAAARALRKLQTAARRRPGKGETAVIIRNLPLELTGGEERPVYVMKDEVQAGEAAVQALIADLRFEHLGGGPWFRGMLELDGKVEQTVEYFADQCRVDRKTDYVPLFVKQYAQDPFDEICYIPVEFLTVTAETEVAGVLFLPVNTPDVLQALEDSGVPLEEEWFSLSTPVGCVAAAEVRGTNQGRMASRARWAIEHALRVLRVALSSLPEFETDHQLRFRRGAGLVSSRGYAEFQGRGDAIIDLPLPDDMSPAASQLVADMRDEPVTDIERHADLALRWMERACLEDDLLSGILFRFFALEALLGDRAEGLKAYSLAFRQAQLAYISTGTIQHATNIWLLYDRVRSVAVHGGEVPDLWWSDAETVRTMISEALNQYLALARQNGLSKRSQLLKFLEEHQGRSDVIRLLNEQGREVWGPYLAELT